MNLRDLRYLVALADERHFGRAAERCFVSQPTLSAQIRKLEEYLGTPLVERQPRRVALTETGVRVVERARRLLQEADAIVELAKRGVGVLWFSTEVEELIHVCHRVVVLYHGEIIADGDFASLEASPHPYVRRFLAGEYDPALDDAPPEVPSALGRVWRPRRLPERAP